MGQSYIDVPLTPKQRAQAPTFEDVPLPSEAALRQQYEDDAQAMSNQQIGQGLIGFAKGIPRTAVGLGRLVHKIPGVDALLGEIPETATATLGLDPTNTPQRVGMGVEQAAEFLIPGGAAERAATAVAARVAPHLATAPRAVRAAASLVPRSAVQAASGGSTAAAQGGDVSATALISGAVPVIGAGVRAGSAYIGSKAEPLVRAAVKPTVSSLKRIAGASYEGLDAKANALVRFIVDNGLTTAAKAQDLFRNTEFELQRVLANRNVVTDAAQRAQRYLGALERNAAKQGLPAEDVAQIRNAAAQLMEGPMGKDVVTMVPTPHPTLLGPNGQPVTVLMPQTSRALRTDVSAKEALESARASSRWSTNKQWGEQKGTAVEATKAVERAQRDAAKVAVPEARALLQTESKAIQAREALDRMAQRQGNREGVGLPAHALAAGGHGYLATATNLLRNQGLRLGIWADRLEKAVARRDVQETAAILSRLGVAVQAQTAGAK